jgi:hypothetical protein
MAVDGRPGILAMTPCLDLETMRQGVDVQMPEPAFAPTEPGDSEVPR